MFLKETTSHLSSTCSESAEIVASQSSSFQRSARFWTPDLPVTCVELAAAILDVLGRNRSRGSTRWLLTAIGHGSLWATQQQAGKWITGRAVVVRLLTCLANSRACKTLQSSVLGRVTLHTCGSRHKSCPAKQRWETRMQSAMTCV